MLNTSIVIAVILLQLHMLYVCPFEAVSNTSNMNNMNQIDDEPIICTGSDVINRMCGRCFNFMQSESAANCCDTLEVQHQCLKLLDELDDVEELLPVGLDVADEAHMAQEDVRGQGNGLVTLHRALGRKGGMGKGYRGGDRLNNDSGANGLDLLLDYPDSYDSPSKRSGLSGKYNRVWWRGPNKRPNNNKVFRNYNRIWWRNGSRR